MKAGRPASVGPGAATEAGPVPGRGAKAGRLAAAGLAWLLLFGSAPSLAQDMSVTPPSNPMLMPTSGMESSSLSFTWTAASPPSGVVLEAYVIHLRVVGGDWGSEGSANAVPAGAAITGVAFRTVGGHTQAGLTTAVAFTGLRAGTTYEARVRAVDGNSMLTAWTAAAQGATGAGPPEGPSSALLAHTDGSLALRWGVPHDGGSAITGYSVRWSASSASSDYLNAGGAGGVSAAAGARMYVLDNLTVGTTYQAQVRATNALGDGAWSEAQERIASAQSGVKMAICVHPVGAPPATFDVCLAAARDGYTINQSSSGTQQFAISLFAFRRIPHIPDETVYHVVLEAFADLANPLVADTDTDGALPSIDGATIIDLGVPSTRRTFPAFSITPKASGDGGRLNIGFAVCRHQ